MKHSAMLRGVAHETRVGVIASATVIRIFVPFVAVFAERLGAASLQLRSRGRTLGAFTAEESKWWACRWLREV